MAGTFDVAPHHFTASKPNSVLLEDDDDPIEHANPLASTLQSPRASTPAPKSSNRRVSAQDLTQEKWRHRQAVHEVCGGGTTPSSLLAKGRAGF